MRRGFWAYCACMLVTGGGLLAGTLEARAAGDDANICIKESGDAAIDACSRAIQSRRYTGHVLAREQASIAAASSGGPSRTMTSRFRTSPKR